MDLNQLDAAETSLKYPAHEIVDLTSDDESVASVAENPLEDVGGPGSEGEEATEGEAESEIEDGSEIWESESLLADVLEELADDNNVFHSGKF
jgi:hypothetical protein